MSLVLKLWSDLYQLSLVDTGDSDLMILPWWGKQTEADLRGPDGSYVVEQPYELVCKFPVNDSFGIRSLLLKGPITVGTDLTFVSEFFQNIDTQGPDNVGNFAPGNAYTHGYGVGKSPIWWSSYSFVELDLRLNRKSTMRFSNRTAIQEGYSVMATDNRTSAMAVLATAIVVDAPGNKSESYRFEFPGKGIEAVLDTGGQASALKADGGFIKAPGWVACESGTEGCNYNCVVGQGHKCAAGQGQGPGSRFFNTSFRVEVGSNESSTEVLKIAI